MRLAHPQQPRPAPAAPAPSRPPKDTEGQVQAKAPGGGELDFVVVQRAVGEDALLDGRLHGALQREAGWWVCTNTVPAGTVPFLWAA